MEDVEDLIVADLSLYIYVNNVIKTIVIMSTRITTLIIMSSGMTTLIIARNVIKVVLIPPI